MSEPSDPSASAGAAYLSVIRDHVRAAERDLKEDERLRVIVSTPDGLLNSTHLECFDPNLLVAYGERGGRITTLITSIESVQIVIEVLPPAIEEKLKPIGFRVQD